MISPELARFLETIFHKGGFNNITKCRVSVINDRRLALIEMVDWEREFTKELAKQLYEWVDKSNDHVVPFQNQKVMITNLDGPSYSFSFVFMSVFFP